jgi:dTDP-4-amino-4,6-dideoxygalactose transaminase
MTGSKQIPFNNLSRQFLLHKEELMTAYATVAETGRLLDGPYTEQFEDWLAIKNQMPYAVTCGSGTNALEIIARYYKENGKYALLPSYTFPATINAFVTAGWDICLADCDEDGVILPPEQHAFDIIVGVGLHGIALPDRLNQGCLVEDGAQHWLSNNCHRMSTTTAISFDPTKNLPNYGNGGAIVTNDDELYEYALNYRAHGKRYVHLMPGSNSRMNEMDCAMLMVKTKYLDQWQAARKQIALKWIDAFNANNIKTMITLDNINKHALHKFVIQVDNRDYVLNELYRNGIEARVHYSNPLHTVGLFAALPYYGGDTSTRLSKCSISLPFYPELTLEEVEFIQDKVCQIVREARPTHNSISDFQSYH